MYSNRVSPARQDAPHTTRLAAAWQERYTQIGNGLHDLADSPREYQLMALLISFRWYETSPIIPSVETLAEAMKCSPRTVRRTAAALEARGLLLREARIAEDGRQMSNLYHLCGALLALVTTVEASRDQGGGQTRPTTWSGAAGKRDPGNQYTRNRRRERRDLSTPIDPARYTAGELGARYVRT